MPTSSAPAMMTPQQAAAAALAGQPFTFPDTPGALAQFQAAYASGGGQVQPAAPTVPATSTGTGSFLDNTLATTAGAMLSFFNLGNPQAVKMIVNTATSPAKSAPGKVLDGIFSWTQPGTWGNVSLIGVGVVLGLGALLIANRGTIVKVTGTAAKAAAMAG